jgi:hypothetical protein
MIFKMGHNEGRHWAFVKLQPQYKIGVGKYLRWKDGLWMSVRDVIFLTEKNPVWDGSMRITTCYASAIEIADLKVRNLI